MVINLKNKSLKVGDYLFWFVGDASPNRDKSNDKYFVNKYIVLDIDESRTLTIKRFPPKNEISKSATRWWYSEFAKDYEIQEIN